MLATKNYLIQLSFTHPDTGKPEDIEDYQTGKNIIMAIGKSLRALKKKHTVLKSRKLTHLEICINCEDYTTI
jgi:hypothetical protein